jgi:hypothetical protein
MYSMIIEFKDGSQWTGKYLTEIKFHSNNAIDIFDSKDSVPYFPNQGEENIKRIVITLTERQK